PLGPDATRCRDLVIAMIAARLTEPTSKLATAKALSPETAASSLGEIMGLGAVDGEQLYRALDWLAERQAAVEAALARRHLHDGTLVLYDVSSSYVEGRRCELARLGYNRDGKRGKLQIVYGLLCAPDGCPIAVEVFDGDTADPMTLSAQVAQLHGRLRPPPRRARRRPRPDHAGPHRPGSRPRRPRLDHGAARPGDPRACRERRAAAVAVRRARHGGGPRARLYGPAPAHVP